MFYSYKGIGVDIKEEANAFYATIGGIEFWGNSIEEVQELLEVEVEDLRVKFYEDVFPPEYEYVGLSISRGQFYSSIKSLARRVEDLSNIFQNPLSNLDELAINNWKSDYRILMQDLASTYNLSAKCIETQGW